MNRKTEACPRSHPKRECKVKKVQSFLPKELVRGLLKADEGRSQGERGMNTMTNVNSKLKIGAFVAASLIGFEAAAEPYIECQAYYQLFTDCVLKNEDEFAQPYSVQLDGETEEVHSEYRFEYRFTCDERKLPLSWQTGDEQRMIYRSESWKPVSIEGVKPLWAVQSKESREQTKREVYREHCNLHVRQVEVIPSHKTVKVWQGHLLDLSGRVSDASYTLDKINDLILFKSAFSFLSELNSLFIHELGSLERQSQLREFEKLKDVFEKMSRNASKVLTEEEVRALKQIMEVSESLADDRIWTNEDGTSKSLSDFMEEDDLKVMEILQKRVESDEDYHEQRLSLYRKMNSWNEKIQTLQKLIEKWQGAHQ